MAVGSRFKQQCPSCEHMVAFEAKVIGRKVQCPKCKYQFVVEDPRERDRRSVEESKNPKSRNGVTAKKPAPKASRGVTAEDAPRRAKKNGVAPVKSKTSPKRRPDDDDLDDDVDDDSFDEPKKGRKKKAGLNKLVVGLGLAAVGLAALGLAAYFLIFKKSDQPANNNNNPQAVAPGQNPGADPAMPGGDPAMPGGNPGAFPPGGDPAMPGGDPAMPGGNPGAFPPGGDPGNPGAPAVKPKPIPIKPAKIDPTEKLTNLLPNDTEHVFRPYFRNLMKRDNAFRKIAFETPGGLSKGEFINNLGISASSVDVLIQAKKFTFPAWSYTVVQSKSGIDAGAVKKALALQALPAIKGQEYFKLGKPNPWLNELAWVSFGVPDTVRQASPRGEGDTFVRFYDDQTVIFADKEPLVALLESDGNFRRLTAERKQPKPPPPNPGGAFPGDPANPGAIPGDPANPGAIPGNPAIPGDPAANPGAQPGAPPGMPQASNQHSPQYEFVSFRSSRYIPLGMESRIRGQAGVAGNLANTNWNGSETLRNYGAVGFEFGLGQRVVMIDKDGRSSGTYLVQKVGNSRRVTMTFFGGQVQYVGTISGNTLKGTARNRADGRTWSFTVSQGAGGQPNPGQNPPMPMPIDPPGNPGGEPPFPPPGGFPPPIPGQNPGGVPPGQFPGGVGHYPSIKNTYLTINPTLKTMLDKMERLAEDNEQILFVAATEMGAARLAAGESDFGPMPRWQFRQLWDVTMLLADDKTNVSVMGSVAIQRETRKFHLRNELITDGTKSAIILTKKLKEEGSPTVARFFDLVLNHEVALPKKAAKRPNPNGFPGGDPNDPNNPFPPNQFPPGEVPPGQPGQFPPGQPGQFPGAGGVDAQAQFGGEQEGGIVPPGQFPPGQPGQFQPGQIPGEVPPGQFPPGQPGQFPPGAFPPGAFPPGEFPPGQFPGMPGGQPKPPPKDVKNSQINITQTQERIVFTLDLVFDAVEYKRFYELAQLLMIGVKGDLDLAAKTGHRHLLSQAAKQLGVTGVPDKGVQPGRFPHGAFPRPSANLVTNHQPQHRVSWMASLLPFLGKDNLFKRIDFQESWQAPSNWMASQTLIPEFLDPTYPNGARYVRHPSLPVDPAATHYVGIAGVGRDAANYPADDPASDQKRGVFGYDRSLSLKEIQDGRGASNTVLLIQVPHNGPAGVTPWIAGGGATLRGVPEKNSIAPFVLTTDGKGQPIMHNGKRGTFVLMVDGTVRFVSENVSDEVFQAMCTVRGPVPAGFNLDNNENVSLIPRPKGGPIQAAK